MFRLPLKLSMLIATGICAAVLLGDVAMAGLPSSSAGGGAGTRDDAANVVSAYTADDGLPQNSVKDIAQTPDGYLWIATQEGVARFDGVRFASFNTRTSPGLVSNNAHQLIVDGNGDLWVLANSGVSRYRHGAFENVTPVNPHGVDRMLYLWRGDDGRVYAISDTTLWRSGNGGAALAPFAPLSKCFPEKQFFFSCSRDGAVWLLGQVSHYLVSIRNGVVRRFDESAHAPYSGMCADAHGTIWLSGTRIWSVGEQGELTEDKAVVPAANQSVAWFLCDPNGLFWFWLGHRLCTYRPGSGKMRVMRTADFDPAWSRIDGNGNFCSLFRAGSQDIVWTAVGGKIVQFKTPGPVAAEWVLPILRTADDVCFVGTYAGLTYMHPGRCETLGLSDRVPEGEIQAVYQTHDGTMWVAGLNNTFGFIRNGQFVRSPDVNLGHADINSMAEDTQGNLWLSTPSNHLWRYTNGRSSDFRASITGVSSKSSISTLARALDGGIWCGIDNNLVHFDGRRARVYATPESSPLMGTIFAILQTRDGRVFVGGQQGFACFHKGRFRYYGPQQGLPSVPVISICEDPRGQIWFGFWGGGLARLKGGALTCLSTRDGLYADSIHAIVMGASNTLWMGSSKGIFSVDLDRISVYTNNVERQGRSGLAPVVCHPLGIGDGMLGGQCSAARQPLAVRALDGSLWFACVRGLARVSANPPAIRRDTSFPIVIERATVDHREIKLDGKGIAPPGAGSLVVEYTALRFLDAGKTRFQYRLFGMDTGWTDADTRRVAYYTNIPPGHYRFEVIACDAFGNWNRSGASFEFTIEPHYYQTLWFRLLMILGWGALAAGIVVFRLRQLHRANRMLEVKVEERTRELGEANRQLWDSREMVLAQNEELQAIQSELEVRNGELAEANEQLHQLAAVDPLTGLKNRRVFQDRIEYSFRVASRYGSNLALVMIDVDAFKSYNDSYGHPQGDDVLKRVASVLLSVARDTDVVCRYGGEEFAVLMPLSAIDAARQLADRMRAAIEQENWPLRPVTASFGLACFDESMSDPAELIQAADAALYESKHSGKNRVTIYRLSPKSQAA